MKKLFSFLLLAFCMQVSAQNNDSIFSRSISWSVPTKGDYGAGPISTSIDWRTTFMYDFKIEHYCDFTYYWKCTDNSGTKLYRMEDGIFKEIKPSQMFSDPHGKLLKMVVDSLRAEFKEYSTGPDGPDCFYDIKLPSSFTLDDFEINANRERIWFSYNFGVIPACDAYGASYLGFTWKEIKPYLNTHVTTTPDYCTPAGPKVNVRTEPSVKVSVNFQLDKGQFFIIKEELNADVVNGKNGHWYSIQYEGKTGYIFSYYTICR